MSQITDYNVANASGAAVRSDINNIFLAVASANSGTAEPSTMYPFMIWVDTTNNLVKLRNGANDGWLTLPYSMTASNTVDIDGGTVDGITSLSVSGTTSLDGAVTINDSSNDVDFRIESDNATHALFVQGSDGNVGIGTSPDNKLHIYKGDSGHSWSFDGDDILIVENSDSLSLNIATPNSNSANILFSDADARGQGRIVYNHSEDSMGFMTAGVSSEKMRLTSAGQVGIGTTSPESFNANRNNLVVSDSGACGITINAGTSDGSFLSFTDGSGTLSGEVQYDHASNYMAFKTNGTEKARIDGSGNFIINGTANQAYPAGSFEALATGTTYCTNTTASGFECQTFRYYNTQVGSIVLSGTTGTNFNTSSDARLKNVLGDAKGLEVINYLNPVNFEWKATEETQDGLIAQEVMEIVPYAVSEDSDGYYQMDYSNLVTPLIKAVQEQQEQIEELKQQINELKEEN